MPYVALPPVDREARLALARVRWASMLTDHPDLSAAISLQQKMIGVVDDLVTSLERGGVPRLSLPARYLATKLSAGMPGLAGEPVVLPVELLRPTLLRLCDTLADGGGGDATLRIRAAVTNGEIDVAALLTLAFRRHQGALRVAATRAGLGHDLLWLVADMAVSPFAHALLTTLYAQPQNALSSALDSWTHGYCPLCGSWPAFVEDRTASHRLRCSFCASAWERTAGSCLYCGEAGTAFETLTPDSSRPGRRIEGCQSCGGYAKLTATDRSLPFPLLPLADLESMDLDLAAMRSGLARPAVKQFSGRR